MLHSHEDHIDNDADDDPEVKEGVGDDGVDPLFQPPPTAAAVPPQEELGGAGAARRL